MFWRGKKKPKEAKQKSVPDFHETKIRDEHGTPVVSLLKAWLVDLGIKMGSEVVVEKRGSNPLQWEIVIKPKIVREKEENEQAASSS